VRGLARGALDDVRAVVARKRRAHSPADERSRGGEASQSPPRAAKRGPRTPLDDAELLTEIRAVLTASPFCSEGHRKAARLVKV
jgi:hypothetical protein